MCCRVSSASACAALPSFRQRPRVRITRTADLDHEHGHRHGVDRSGQALAEWGDGELQRKFRDECLSLEWFRSRAEAKVVIESWRRITTRCARIRAWATSRRRFMAKIEEQDAASGRQRAGSLRYGASALRPVAPPSRKGQSKTVAGVACQVKRGPKKQGRSVPWEALAYPPLLRQRQRLFGLRQLTHERDPRVSSPPTWVASQGFTECCVMRGRGLMCHVYGFGLGYGRRHCSNDPGAAVAVVA